LAVYLLDPRVKTDLLLDLTSGGLDKNQSNQLSETFLLHLALVRRSHQTMVRPINQRRAVFFLMIIRKNQKWAKELTITRHFLHHFLVQQASNASQRKKDRAARSLQEPQWTRMFLK
jgi:hypothetical protein